MTFLLRGGAAALLACALGPTGDSQALPDAASPSPAPSGSSTPAVPASARPLSTSIDQVVEKLEGTREDPCATAREAGLPCFPTSVDVRSRYSVADDVRSWRFDGGPAPNAKIGITFDPVCAVKGLVKAVKGRNDTYYLYRMWDRVGPQVVLRETPINPETWLAHPEVRYELLGEIRGECEALQAYRRELRRELRRDLPQPAWPEKPAPRATPSLAPR